jgi:hypothetical protein
MTERRSSRTEGEDLSIFEFQLGADALLAKQRSALRSLLISRFGASNSV